MSPVPAVYQPAPEEIATMVSQLSGRKVLVLTGAGVSTESGIPDYRSPGRPEYKPMTHHQFMTSEATRRKYWARSFVGFASMSRARPNDTHRILADLQRTGHLGNIITQNVDRLHQAAGADHVLELHGTIHEVDCLQCGARIPRAKMQEKLAMANPDSASLISAVEEQMRRPDGDVVLPEEVYATFNVPTCSCCGGTLKPAVVFTGGFLDAKVKQQSEELLMSHNALLVLGSTLQFLSALRPVREMHAATHPVVIVTYGDTRGDAHASLKIRGSCSAVLKEFSARLPGPVKPPHFFSPTPTQGTSSSQASFH